MIPGDSRSKKTILCIDDDVSILRYEKALLERSEYSSHGSVGSRRSQARDNVHVPCSWTTTCRA